VNNLPIEVLPAGKVIAVSAMRDPLRRISYRRKIFSINWQKAIFANGYSIIQKTIDIVLAQNESQSVRSRKDVTYIRPEFDNLDYYDFSKYLQFIESGYKKAQQSI
jgi:hypothetical protein